MRELKVEKYGESTALLLDEEALKMLGASVGDSFILTEYEEGYRLIPKNSELGEALMCAKRVMTQFDGALRKLAESDRGDAS